MIPDFKIIRVIFEVFRALDLEVIVKVNHRRILDGLFTVIGVPSDRLRSISSAVNELDKASWSEVKMEMVEEKSLPEAVADRVGEYIRHNGTMEKTLEVLKSNQHLMAKGEVKAGVADMELLARYLKAMSVFDIVSFDLSLVGGLNYYTGLTYEVIPKPAKGQSLHVGGVAAGGRYDSLAGMYGKRPAPCVGLSFGVACIFTVLQARQNKKDENEIARETDVYVMTAGDKSFDGLLKSA